MPGNVRQLYNVVEHACALATAPLVPLSLVQRALRVPSLEVLSYTEAKQRFERVADGDEDGAAPAAGQHVGGKGTQRHGRPGAGTGEDEEGDGKAGGGPDRRGTFLQGREGKAGACAQEIEQGGDEDCRAVGKLTAADDEAL